MASPSFFTNENFMPHGMCYLWQPNILWTSVISDVLTAFAYFSITAAVIIFVKKRHDLPYPWFFLLSGSVIFLACGISHLISAIVIWEPIYGISAVAKAITAITSVATGIVIWFILPFFLKLPSPSMLEKKNSAIQDSLNKLKLTQKSLVESKKMASLGGLVAGVAHEINTPIGIGITASTHLSDATTSINDKYTNAQMTNNNLKSYLAEVNEGTNLINSNLVRAAKLITSFKQVAVDQSSKDIRTYKIKEYTNEVLQSLKPKFKNTNISIKLNCDDNLTVTSEPGAFAQIITNLVINTLIHGFENIKTGNINIDITRKQDTVCFVYTDSGKGINIENKEKIFEPFFTTKRGKGGTGLGLNIVYNLVVESLKGSIKLNDDFAQGCQFIIEFPININH
ncbi:MAG: HAMP domain-containing histidine kinase [Saccharospirillaceae bacterium]|nr:HAMP domain-containing histidine kinase [Pseudomonadales bacterium]NRB80046.1 HAMP domain-containing histidine kinase [Saccharospirillaceae bacterium]